MSLDTTAAILICQKMHIGKYLEIFDTTEEKNMRAKDIGQVSEEVRKMLEWRVSYSDAK